MQRMKLLSRRFLREQRAAASVVFGLSALIIIALVAATIEFAVVSQRSDKAQNAVDAATLSAAISYSQNTSADYVKEFNNVFYANFAPDNETYEITDLSIIREADGVFKGSVTLILKNNYFNSIGKENGTITKSARAGSSGKAPGIEISFAIDQSNAMAPLFAKYEPPTRTVPVPGGGSNSGIYKIFNIMNNYNGAEQTVEYPNTVYPFMELNEPNKGFVSSSHPTSAVDFSPSKPKSFKEYYGWCNFDAESLTGNKLSTYEQGSLCTPLGFPIPYVVSSLSTTSKTDLGAELKQLYSKISSLYYDPSVNNPDAAEQFAFNQVFFTDSISMVPNTIMPPSPWDGTTFNTDEFNQIHLATTSRGASLISSPATYTGNISLRNSTSDESPNTGEFREGSKLLGVEEFSNGLIPFNIVFHGNYINLLDEWPMKPGELLSGGLYKIPPPYTTPPIMTYPPQIGVYYVESYKSGMVGGFFETGHRDKPAVIKQGPSWRGALHFFLGYPFEIVMNNSDYYPSDFQRSELSGLVSKYIDPFSITANPEVGLAWAYYTLSPNWKGQFDIKNGECRSGLCPQNTTSENFPKPYGDGNKKILVMITANQKRVKDSSYFTRMCDDIKDKGIMIFTAANLSDPDQSTFASCASDGHSYGSLNAMLDGVYKEVQSALQGGGDSNTGRKIRLLPN